MIKLFLGIVALCAVVFAAASIFVAVEIRHWRVLYVDALYKLWNLPKVEKKLDDG